MHLRVKLESLQKQDLVDQLHHLLLYPTITSNWWGERSVTVGGYEGAVSFEFVQSIFFSSDTFCFGEPVSLAKKIAIFNLWDRLVALDEQSRIAFEQSLAFKCLSFIKRWSWEKESIPQASAILIFNQWDPETATTKTVFLPEQQVHLLAPATDPKSPYFQRQLAITKTFRVTEGQRLRAEFKAQQEAVASSIARMSPAPSRGSNQTAFSRVHSIATGANGLATRKQPGSRELAALGPIFEPELGTRRRTRAASRAAPADG